jgi:hypothetical protein
MRTIKNAQLLALTLVISIPTMSMPSVSYAATAPTQAQCMIIVYNCTTGWTQCCNDDLQYTVGGQLLQCTDDAANARIQLLKECSLYGQGKGPYPFGGAPDPVADTCMDFSTVGCAIVPNPYPVP